MSTTPAVCHIPPTNQIKQPAPQNVPAIPPASPNLASLTATVNALRQAMIFILGQQSRQNPQRWKETSRTTSKVKIYDPNDKTVFVEIEQINSLTMTDGVTGETWGWHR